MLTRDELDAIRGHIMGVNVRVLPGPNANAGDTIAPWVTVCGSAAVDEIFAQAALSSPSPRAAAYQAARDRFEAALAMAVGKGERHDA